MTDLLNEILKVIPSRLAGPLSVALSAVRGIYEIRLVADTSLYLVTEKGILFIDENGNLSRAFPKSALRPCFSELDEIIDRSVGYSGFFRENELKNGYVTYSRGIRIGLGCDKSPENGSIGKINSLCIRIPFFGNTDSRIDYQEILSFSRGLLVAGAPASGKTTLLREIAVKLSSGFAGEYKKVCVIDERGELSAGKNLGMCADVIRGQKKADAILHAVRLLSPRYIICDEIGGYDETKSILQGLNSGVSFIASIHAEDVSSLVKRQQFKTLFRENVFDKAVFLSGLTPGKITGIYSYGELLYEIGRTYEPLYGSGNDGFLSFFSA